MSTFILNGLWKLCFLSIHLMRISVSSLGIDRTHVWTSSSVTSISTQFSSSVGNGYWLPAVTQGCCCKCMVEVYNICIFLVGVEMMGCFASWITLKDKTKHITYSKYGVTVYMIMLYTNWHKSWLNLSQRLAESCKSMLLPNIIHRREKFWKIKQ